MDDFEVDVNPDVLTWARASIRLSRQEAAKRLSLSDLELRWLEEGAPPGPTLRQMRKMADLYKRPLAVFLLPAPPKDFDALKDFRLLPGNEGRTYSRALLMAFRRVYMQREVIRELADLADETPPPLDLSLSLDDDPEQAGDRIRAWLGMPLSIHDLRDTDRRRTDHLNRWIALIEAKTILVTQITPVDLTEMRGCSISDQPFPVIILNGSESPRGKVFTLVHELVHILLRAGGLCDLDERQRRPRTDHADRETTERVCNYVAGATLMPRPLVLRDLADMTVTRSAPATRWTEQDLTLLAEMYGVSQEAMLIRLVHIDRASWDDYETWRPHFRLRKGRAGGYRDYYRGKVQDFGRRYVTTVLDAYHNRDITASEVSDYLEIRANSLPRLEAALEG